jgi:hypothetical protein
MSYLYEKLVAEAISKAEFGSIKPRIVHQMLEGKKEGN